MGIDNIDTLKLLTLAAICYEKNLDIIRSKMKNSKEIADLYMELPTVQYVRYSMAISRLADSNIDVNKIQNIEEITKILFPS